MALLLRNLIILLSINLSLISQSDALGFIAIQTVRAHKSQVGVSSLHLNSSSSSEDVFVSDKIANNDQLKIYASKVGVNISLTTLGPGYRAVARASHDPDQILGYCEGFARGEILHVDKLEVWKKALDRAKNENPKGFKNGGQVFGVSILLGYITMLFGQEKDCDRAEFLAIDDEEFQHKRLVRFFKRAGFEKVRYVGENISSIPDRLVWGGCGTLMNQKIDKLLTLWTKIIFKNIIYRQLVKIAVQVK